MLQSYRAVAKELRKNCERKTNPMKVRGKCPHPIAQYEKCREKLLEELGGDTMPETTALHEQLLAAHKIGREPAYRRGCKKGMPT